MRGDAPLAVSAYTQDGKRLLGTGTLELIDNAVDQATGTIRLKARFPNDDEVLWPGQFVNIRLMLTTRRDGTVVAGRAAVDQSAITGESLHHDVGPGSPVFAGTVAIDAEYVRERLASIAGNTDLSTYIL